MSSGFQGQATDIEIHAREIIDIRQRLDQIIAKHTEQDYDKVRNDTERDYFMSLRRGQELRHHRSGDLGALAPGPRAS